MALTITDRGTSQTTAGGAITLATTSAAFSAAAGTILVAAIIDNSVAPSAGGPYTISFALSDTIADTGGGTWTQQASCTRGAVTALQYAELVTIYTRVVGTSPGASKTVTATGTMTGGTTTSSDGWVAMHVWEVANQHATPIGATASPSPVTTSTTFTATLSGTPASDSAVFGVVMDDNDSITDIVQPGGWTESDDQHPTPWDAPAEWAFINGSSVTAPQWSGFTSGASVRLLGCAVEIKAAASAGPTPIGKSLVFQALDTAYNW